MPATTQEGVQYAFPSDAPNVATITQNLATSITKLITSSWASIAARAAAITSPQLGQLTYRVDGKGYEMWDGAGWAPLPGYVWGEASTSGSATLATAVTNVAVDSTNKVTITLTAQRRIIVEAQAFFTAATAPARYSIIPAYTAGNSVGAITVIGTNTVRVPVSNTAAGGLNTGFSRQSVVLAAGTYTFFVAAARDNGGSATDTASSPTVRVIDGGLA